jgi:hypothetical protein
MFSENTTESGYVIRPCGENKNKCTLHYIVQVDPKVISSSRSLSLSLFNQDTTLWFIVSLTPYSTRLQGLIPTWIVNLASTSQGLNVKRIRDVFIKGLHKTLPKTKSEPKVSKIKEKSNNNVDNKKNENYNQNEEKDSSSDEAE